GVVDDAVRLQGEEGVDVVGGGDTDRVDPAELADVASDLVGGPGIAPDELQIGMGHDGADRSLADVASRPLHHSDGHRPSLLWTCYGSPSSASARSARSAIDRGASVLRSRATSSMMPRSLRSSGMAT